MSCLSNISFFHFVQQSKFWFSEVPYPSVINTSEEKMLRDNSVNLQKYPLFGQQITYKESNFNDWLDFYEKNVIMTEKLNTGILKVERSLFNYISAILYENIEVFDDRTLFKLANKNPWFTRNKALINLVNDNMKTDDNKLTKEGKVFLMKEKLNAYIRSLGLPEMKEILSYLNAKNFINLNDSFEDVYLNNMFLGLSAEEKLKRITLIKNIRNQTFHGKLITYGFRETPDLVERKIIYNLLLEQEVNCSKYLEKGNLFTIWKLAQTEK